MELKKLISVSMFVEVVPLILYLQDYRLYPFVCKH
ncbi:hypothetical protein ACUXIS_001151 [Cytobacillus horneckiae]